MVPVVMGAPTPDLALLGEHRPWGFEGARIKPLGVPTQGLGLFRGGETAAWLALPTLSASAQG